jgi:hypothetical protein
VDLLAKLDAGQSLKVGWAKFTRTRGSVQGTLVATTETARVIFTQFDAGGSPTTRGNYITPLSLVPGTCFAARYSGELGGTVDANPLVTIGSTAKSSDAGAVALEGPGKSQQLDSDGNGGYVTTLADGVDISIPGVPSVPGAGFDSFLKDGNWTMRGAGGRTIGAFSAPFSIGDTLSVSVDNRSLFFPRNQPWRYNWTGGGSGPDDYVMVIGMVTNVAAGASADIGVFQCRVPAVARTFTVPADIISQMPSVSAFVQSYLISTPVSSTFRFNAPVTNSGNLDWAQGQITITETWPSVIQ